MPGLVINPVFIIEIVLILKVVLVLVASRVGVPKASVDISSSARIDRIRAIGVNRRVTIESIAVAN
jgi:hypothetical protein